MANYYILAGAVNSSGGCCCGCNSSDCATGLTSCGGCGENYLCYGETACENGYCAYFNSDCTTISYSTGRCSCCAQSYKPINSSSSSSLHPCGAISDSNGFWTTSGYSKSDFSWGSPSCQYIGLCNYVCSGCTTTCSYDYYYYNYCSYAQCGEVRTYAGIQYCNSNTAVIDTCSTNKYTSPKPTNPNISKPYCYSSGIDCSWFTPAPCSPPVYGGGNYDCEVYFPRNIDACGAKLGNCNTYSSCCGKYYNMEWGYWLGDACGNIVSYCPGCHTVPLDCVEIGAYLAHILRTSYECTGPY